jgi:DNA polymerase-3 subunit alpha
MDYGEVDKVAKMIPNEPKMTLEKAMKMNPEFKNISSQSDIHKELIKNSSILEGMHRY